MHFNSHNSIVGVCEVGGCDDDFAKMHSSHWCWILCFWNSWVFVDCNYMPTWCLCELYKSLRPKISKIWMYPLLCFPGKDSATVKWWWKRGWEDGKESTLGSWRGSHSRSACATRWSESKGSCYWICSLNCKSQIC